MNGLCFWVVRSVKESKESGLETGVSRTGTIPCLEQKAPAILESISSQVFSYTVSTRQGLHHLQVYMHATQHAHTSQHLLDVQYEIKE